jgi:hypothetical protein
MKGVRIIWELETGNGRGRVEKKKAVGGLPRKCQDSYNEMNSRPIV